MINSNFIELNRIGYGSNFNKLNIDYSNNIIKKECINSYGLKKINYEKKFYQYLIDNNIEFNYPKIYNFNDNGYTMQYLKEYNPLYKYYKNFDEKTKDIILLKIKSNLDKLHNSTKIYLSKEEFIENINFEINDKILERFNLIKNIISKYNFIKKVNNIEILSFEEILSKLNKKINDIIIDKEFYFVPIHGDCQFNNILFNNKTNDLFFIDPRGYFGKNEIFGLEEYDMAKIYFALSGYDEFDNREINNLDIENDNINIFLDILDNKIFEKNNLSILLMISIWLGNAQCFINNNEFKGIYSYFIALYLGTILLKNEIISLN